MKDSQRVEEIMRMVEVVKSGYAGVMRGTGTIVDRREHPEAQPIPENKLLGAPPPKQLPEGSGDAPELTFFDLPNGAVFRFLKGRKGTFIKTGYRRYRTVDESGIAFPHSTTNRASVVLVAEGGGSKG